MKAVIINLFRKPILEYRVQMMFVFKQHSKVSSPLLMRYREKLKNKALVIQHVHMLCEDR